VINNIQEAINEILKHFQKDLNFSQSKEEIEIFLSENKIEIKSLKAKKYKVKIEEELVGIFEIENGEIKYVLVII